MKTYVCKWPNGTISILKAGTERELYFKLDIEGMVSERCKIYEMPQHFHIGTELVKNNENKIEILCDLVDSKIDMEEIQLKINKKNEYYCN